MLRLTINTIRANKARFILTASSVILGVTFMVASFVLADGLRKAFDKIASDSAVGTDLTVRGELPFGNIAEASTPPVADSLLPDVLAVDGVAKAEGTFFVLQPPVIPIDGTGDAVTTFGPPMAGTAWTQDEEIAQVFLIEGQKPVGPDQIAVDRGTYEDFDFVIGQRYDVITPTGTKNFELSGVMQFGFPDDNGAGVVFVVWDPAVAPEVLGLEGQFSQINVVADPSADIAALQTAISDVVPAGIEVITAAETTQEFSDAFESFIGPLQTILLVFAFIILFVSLFVISNTFNIVLGQRTRELGLLRAIGATPQQIRGSVLGEAVAIGILAVVSGLILGVLLAMGLRSLLDSFASGIPDGGLPLRARTIIAAVIVGIFFTIAAMLLPAIKASRTPPIQALRSDPGGGDEGAARWRPLVGGGLGLLAIALFVAGLFVDFGSVSTKLSSLGAGAAFSFIAVGILSPLFARPIVSALGRPLAAFGSTGRLARENAARSPRRTASTAVALTIGLALVSTVAIVGESLKQTFSQILDTAVTADYIITEPTGLGVPQSIADDIRNTEGVADVVTFRGLPSQIDGSEVFLLTTNITDIDQVANLDVVDGSLGGFDPATDLLLQVDVANDKNLAIGDSVTASFLSGETRDLTVHALYKTAGFWGNWLIDNGVYDEVATTSSDDVITVKTSGGDNTDAVRAAIETALEPYPQVKLEDRAEFQKSLESQLNIVLGLVFVFLFLALIIALFGIVNTLTLSVFERTREIGLLRAVGMTRRQTRRMIRWEAIIVALFGALLGLVMGVIFGSALAYAIPEDIISLVAIPIPLLVTLVIVAGVFGLLAALYPAWKASRMNVLDAIAHE